MYKSSWCHNDSGCAPYVSIAPGQVMPRYAKLHTSITAQRSTAQHSTAQHSTAWHGMEWHGNGLLSTT